MLRRTLVSALATAGFVVLAFGSGSGTPKPTARVSVPALTIGQPAAVSVTLDNQTDASFAWQTVNLKGDFARAVSFDGTGGVSPQAMQAGDGWQAKAPGNVAIGAQSTVTLDITPKVPGKHEGRVTLCDAGGTCASGSFTATIPGQPVTLRQISIDVPQTATSGSPFTIDVEVRNNGTLPDEVATITLPEELVTKVTVGRVQPMPTSMEDSFKDKELTFDQGLKPGEALSVSIELTPTGTGAVTDVIEVCGPGGMFDCEDVDFAITLE